MKQCLKCLSEDVKTVVDQNRIFYQCYNCGSVKERIVDKSGQICSTIENGLVRHVTVAAMIKQGNRILLVNRRNFPFGLCFPCGHLEYGETPSKAIEREVMEELGFNVQNKKLIFHETILDQCKSGGDLHEWYLYDCKISGQIVLNSETNEANWVNMKDLECSDIVPPAKIVMSKLGLIRPRVEGMASTNNYLAVSKAKNAVESAIERLPMAIIILNKKGEISFSNQSSHILLENINTTADHNKLSAELSNFTRESLASFSEISRKISIGKKIYSITVTPLKNNKSALGATAVIKNVSQEHKQNMKDVIAYQTSLSLCGSMNSMRIIKTVLKQLLFSFNITGINLMLREENKLRVAFHYEKNRKIGKPTLVLKIGEGIAGIVAEQKHLQAIPDISLDSRFIGDKSKPHSLLSIPIISNNTVLGVLDVIRPKNIYFEEDEVNMVAIVANRIALALENETLNASSANQKNTLEKVLGATSDGLIMVDKNINLIFANEAAVKLLPLRKNDLQNKTIENYLSGLSIENSEKMQKYIQESIKRKKTFTVEFISKKGPEKVVRTSFNPVIEKGEGCSSVLIGFSDTTKLANKQKTVKKQVEQLTELFKISSLSITSSSDFFRDVLKKTAVILDSEISDIYFFDSNNDISGFVKNTDPDIFNLISQIKKTHPLDSFICNNVKNHFVNAAKIFKIITAPIQLNGKEIGILYAINKNKNYNSKDIKWLSIIAARLASRLETEKLFKQIKKDERNLENIINNSGDGITVIDARGNSIFWNKAMEQITGYKTLKELLYSNPNAKTILARDPEQAVIEKTKAIYKEIKIVNFDGQEQWLGITFSFTKNETGIEYYIAILRDISKEKAVEDRNREFVYTTTHELRTPITAIKGYLSMILNGDAGAIKPNQKKYFYRAYKSTENLVSLVEDILKTAQLEEDKLEFIRNPFNLDKVVNNVATDYYQKAKNKKLDLKISRRLGNIKVIGDFDKTKQAISNLVDNAIKYTTYGNITIRLASNENMGTIIIEDTGVGIPMTDQEMIFTKFYRVPNSESVRAGGTGLGLFIVKNLIEKQNGEVKIISKLGKGTSISISLPLAK